MTFAKRYRFSVTDEVCELIQILPHPGLVFTDELPKVVDLHKSEEMLRFQVFRDFQVLNRESILANMHNCIK